MFLIPGWAIALLTFPGVILHEVAHRFFADLMKVPVYQVRYFRLGNPAGYVLHGHPQNIRSSLLISVGPLIVNTALCAVLTFFPYLGLFFLDIPHFGDNEPIFILLGWLGISIGMHAFPSNEDMQNLSVAVQEKRGSGPILWIAKFFSIVFLVANALRVLWFDAVYACLVAIAIPVAFGFR
jgi:hypothetical protein